MEVDLKAMKQQWDTEGWLFVPQLLDHDTVSLLRMTAERCLSQWRLRSPETNAPGGFSGAKEMRHLNHPGYYEAKREQLTHLLETTADPLILSIVKAVLNDEPLFRCTSLFMNPLDSSADGNWHRDIQFTYPIESEERAQLEKIWETGTNGIQLQIALVPSDDAEYVPGSHLRWDTNEEYTIRCANERKDNTSNEMPGAVRIALQPGDAVAFNAAGIHRGRYHTHKYRRTLMLTYSAANGRCRRDYFSNQPWCLGKGYIDGLSEGATDFWQQFIDTYRDYWEDEEREHRGKATA